VATITVWMVSVGALGTVDGRVKVVDADGALVCVVKVKEVTVAATGLGVVMKLSTEDVVALSPALNVEVVKTVVRTGAETLKTVVPWTVVVPPVWSVGVRTTSVTTVVR
jgi:hypothetical protein